MESTGAKKRKFKMCEGSSLTELTDMDNPKDSSSAHHGHNKSRHNNDGLVSPKQNQVGNVMLFGVPIVSLVMDGKERLCLAQISSTLLKEFSYNEIHNRRVALGITCIQCTPVQLEILRRAGAMPVTSRRCGMITKREAERLCQSFLGDHAPPQLPENFAFDVYHECAWGCRGAFVPSRYNSSRAKCIRCSFCQLFFSPNKFIFHSHRLPDSRYVQPDAANFNSWRRHLKLCGDPPNDETSVSPSSSPALYPKINPSSTLKEQSSRSHESLGVSTINNCQSMSMATAQIVHAWEDVKAMFNGGTRKRLLAVHSIPSPHSMRQRQSSSTAPVSSQNQHSSGNSNNNHNNNKHSSSSAPTSSSSSSTLTSSNNNHNNHHPNNHSNSSSVSSRAATPQVSRHHSHHGQSHGQSHGHVQPNYGHPCDTLPPSVGGSGSVFINSTVTSPLLSPTSRLETIWNPGIAAAAAAAARQCQLSNSSPQTTLPPLPFHPLSIPWLRRPLFPFSHPFGPTCKLFGENPNGVISPDSSSNSSMVSNGRSTSGGVQGQQNLNMSAFKPVGVGRSGAEQLFSWLSNNNSIGNVGSLIPTHSTLPEDLSLNSSCPTDPHSVNDSNGHHHQHGNHNKNIYSNNPILLAASNVLSSSIPPPLVPSSPVVILGDHSKELLVNPSLSTTSLSSGDSCASNLNNSLDTINYKKYSSHHHQHAPIQVLSPIENQRSLSSQTHRRASNEDENEDEDESDDEENVDIESTEVDQDPDNHNVDVECESNNTTTSSRHCHLNEGSGNSNSNNSHGHGCSVSLWMNNNNSQTNLNQQNPSQIKASKRKVVTEEDSMEEDEMKNHDDITNTGHRSIRSSHSHYHSHGKKKRLWDCDRRVINVKSAPVPVTDDGSRSGCSSNSTTPELLSLTD